MADLQFKEDFSQRKQLIFLSSALSFLLMELSAEMNSTEWRVSFFYTRGGGVLSIYIPRVSVR